MTRILPFSLLILFISQGCGDFDLPRRSSSSRYPNSSASDPNRRIVVNGGSSIQPGYADGGVPQPGLDGGWFPSQPDTRPGNPQQPDSATPPPATGVCGNAFESEVFKLVNQERAKNGMQAFECGPIGIKVAHDYSQLMCDTGHFDHTGPDGSSPFERMQKGGINFQTAGENIAAGQATPEEVMQSWMSSSGHRANILGDFKYIGIGYVECKGGWGHYWTQDFWT
jgi:uncharacterized protein YkwD